MCTMSQVEIIKLLNESGYNSFKEFFSDFLDYIDKTNKIDELREKIKQINNGTFDIEISEHNKEKKIEAKKNFDLTEKKNNEKHAPGAEVSVDTGKGSGKQQVTSNKPAKKSAGRGR